MFKRFSSLLLIGVFAAVRAQDAETTSTDAETTTETETTEPVEYERFATAMETAGFTWAAFNVETEDGYTLTTFRVTGKVGEEPFVADKPPVVFMHGAMDDAASWVGASDGAPNY